MGYYMQVSARETHKSIGSQTNPSPPPSCCIQVLAWPVIWPSVEETCGHLMTPTGVMHAIAQDGAMTVSFIHTLGNERDFKVSALPFPPDTAGCLRRETNVQFWGEGREMCQILNIVRNLSPPVNISAKLIFMGDVPDECSSLERMQL